MPSFAASAKGRLIGFATVATDSQKDYLIKKALVAQVLMAWKSENLTFGQMADKILSALDTASGINQLGQSSCNADHIAKADELLRRFQDWVVDTDNNALYLEIVECRRSLQGINGHDPQAKELSGELSELSKKPNAEVMKSLYSKKRHP